MTAALAYVLLTAVPLLRCVAQVQSFEACLVTAQLSARCPILVDVKGFGCSWKLGVAADDLELTARVRPVESGKQEFLFLVQLSAQVSHAQLVTNVLRNNASLGTMRTTTAIKPHSSIPKQSAASVVNQAVNVTMGSRGGKRQFERRSHRNASTSSVRSHTTAGGRVGAKASWTFQSQSEDKREGQGSIRKLLELLLSNRFAESAQLQHLSHGFIAEVGKLIASYQASLYGVLGKFRWIDTLSLLLCKILVLLVEWARNYGSACQKQPKSSPMQPSTKAACGTVEGTLDKRATYAGIVTNTLLMNLALIYAFLVLVVTDAYRSAPSLPMWLLWLMEVNVVFTLVFLTKYATWEGQRHLITLWQLSTATLFFLMRYYLFSSPALLTGALLLLVVSSYAGAVVEFTSEESHRMPPFPMRKDSMSKQTFCGWLGPKLVSKCSSEVLRWMVTFVFWLAYHPELFILAYIPQEHLPQFTSVGLDPLFLVSCASVIIAQVFSMPYAMYSLWNLHYQVVQARRVPQANFCGPYDHVHIGDDTDLSDARCHSVTVIVPCYMPNEQSIIMDTLAAHKKLGDEYHGDLCVIVVWNSPYDHPEIEVALKELQNSWSQLTVQRVRESTSKADNLNVALDMVDTDMVLLNDADTIVSAQTVTRASKHLFGYGLDFVSARPVYTWADTIGFAEAGVGFSGAPPVTVTIDSCKASNVNVQDFNEHTCFTGRGGFWRTKSIQRVGFDPHLLGEDIDASYRAYAYFGMRGALDMNALYVERVPPSWRALGIQRHRWVFADYERRAIIPSVLRSPHIPWWEKFFIAWAMEEASTMPVQNIGQNVFLAFVVAILVDRMPKVMADPNCGSYSLGLCMLALMIIRLLSLMLQYVYNVSWTAFQPRMVFACIYVPLNCMYFWFRRYILIGVLHAYLWGGAKWKCTPRTASN